ncbi:hypothetical protein L6164_025230 [Bauhinia variegata]|uniref:Uncharacterized protein n=1 Tax=Bauhinia variegata TaxID=167791 RepID=A0ACB9M1C0_BAUVA|nr:hypothetical protein L6164_025230 [Bauhinia variegata]
MTMLSVCSATPSYSPCQNPLYGGLQPLYPFSKELESRCVAEGVRLGLRYGNHTMRNSFVAQATKSGHISIIKSAEQSVSLEFPDSFFSANEPGHLKCEFTSMWSSPEIRDGQHSLSSGEFRYKEIYNLSAVPEDLMDFTEQSTKRLDTLVAPGQPETILSTDITSENFAPAPSSINMDNESLASTKASVGDIFTGINESLNASINKGESALQSSLDTTTSLIKSVIENATKSVDNAFGEVLSAADQTGELANKKLTNFSSEINAVVNKAPAIAINLLRKTIVVVENSLISGTSYVVYLYGLAKDVLPVGIRDTVNVYEEKATEILRPIGSTYQEIYMSIYSLEESLGLDPNDPIVPFLVFLGSSATLWVIYWFWTYGGYSGDLPPQSALELLTGNENAALIDIRNEDLREKDGIPDLRRAARFRYASVAPLEVDVSIRKLLKRNRDLDESLMAVIIQNLKIVKDSSKVIIMDADGRRSKGIARALRKIGIKNSYLVHGGFQSWVKQGLRIKELTPETALSILNEETEAILEDINPSPLQVLGYGTVLIAGLFGLLEWEKTLQFIGILGISLTIYRRVASYENANDLKQDVRALLGPFRLGAQAFSWAAGKLESNGIGLPTSPSSSDVQNRVLQAAAKHESQPSDTEDTQDPAPDPNVTLNENI